MKRRFRPGRPLLGAGLLTLIGFLGLGCGAEEGPNEPGPELPAVDCEGVGAELSTVQLFDQVVQPRCTSCHQAGGTGVLTGKLSLTSPQELQATVGAASLYAGQGGLKIVDPAKPENSSLLLKVLGGSPAYVGPGDENVGAKMPSTGLLPEAEREQFRRWICGGAD